MFSVYLNGLCFMPLQGEAQLNIKPQTLNTKY